MTLDVMKAQWFVREHKWQTEEEKYYIYCHHSLQKLAHANHSRYIGHIVFTAEEGNSIFAVMPLYTGYSVDKLDNHRKWNRFGHYGITFALRYLSDALRALEFIHAAGWLHLDGKDANAMIDFPSDTIKSIDMDHSIFTPAHAKREFKGKLAWLVKKKILHLTPECAPSEFVHVQGSQIMVSEATDLYQVGFTFLKILGFSLVNADHTKRLGEFLEMFLPNNNFFNMIVTLATPDRHWTLRPSRQDVTRATSAALEWVVNSSWWEGKLPTYLDLVAHNCVAGSFKSIINDMKQAKSSTQKQVPPTPETTTSESGSPQHRGQKRQQEKSPSDGIKHERKRSKSEGSELQVEQSANTSSLADMASPGRAFQGEQAQQFRRNASLTTSNAPNMPFLASSAPSISSNMGGQPVHSSAGQLDGSIPPADTMHEGSSGSNGVTLSVLDTITFRDLISKLHHYLVSHKTIFNDMGNFEQWDGDSQHYLQDLFNGPLRVANLTGEELLKTLLLRGQAFLSWLKAVVNFNKEAVTPDQKLNQDRVEQLKAAIAEQWDMNKPDLKAEDLLAFLEGTARLSKHPLKLLPHVDNGMESPQHGGDKIDTKPQMERAVDDDDDDDDDDNDNDNDNDNDAMTAHDDDADVTSCSIEFVAAVLCRFANKLRSGRIEDDIIRWGMLKYPVYSILYKLVVSQSILFL